MISRMMVLLLLERVFSKSLKLYSGPKLLWEKFL